jgi:thymidine kinase
MFSGKTEFLIDDIIPRLRKYGKKELVILKPEIDKRSGVGKIKAKLGKTANEKTMDAIDVPHNDMGRILKTIYDEEKKRNIKFNVIAFDEVQFFSEIQFYRLTKQLLGDGYDVIVVGLERDFRDEPFGPIPYLKIIRDFELEVTNLDSRTYCMKCSKAGARYPQRLIDGKPASYHSPQVQVGGSESYEARCADCHEVPAKPRIEPN